MQDNSNWWEEKLDSSIDSGIERMKAAFERDWNRIKGSFFGRQLNLNQDFENPIEDAQFFHGLPLRAIPNYEEAEPAYHFGAGAHDRFGTAFPEWDEELELTLKDNWIDLHPEEAEYWARFSKAVRRGFEIRADQKQGF